jgi:hypothetical protein
MDASPTDPTPKTNPRGAWIVAIVLIVVILAAGVTVLLVSRNADPACADWNRSKAEWVASFPPIEQKTKADLADYQGWVDLNGARVARPDGC